MELGKGENGKHTHRFWRNFHPYYLWLFSTMLLYVFIYNRVCMYLFMFIYPWTRFCFFLFNQSGCVNRKYEWKFKNTFLKCWIQELKREDNIECVINKLKTYTSLFTLKIGETNIKLAQDSQLSAYFQEWVYFHFANMAFKKNFEIIKTYRLIFVFHLPSVNTNINCRWF